MSDQFNKHRHTEDNNDDTPFEFTPENMRKVETVLGKYPDNYKQRYVDVCVTFLSMLLNSRRGVNSP